MTNVNRVIDRIEESFENTKTQKKQVNNDAQVIAETGNIDWKPLMENVSLVLKFQDMYRHFNNKVAHWGAKGLADVATNLTDLKLTMIGVYSAPLMMTIGLAPLKTDLARIQNIPHFQLLVPACSLLVDACTKRSCSPMLRIKNTYKASILFVIDVLQRQTDFNYGILGHLIFNFVYMFTCLSFITRTPYLPILFVAMVYVLHFIFSSLINIAGFIVYNAIKQFI